MPHADGKHYLMANITAFQDNVNKWNIQTVTFTFNVKKKKKLEKVSQCHERSISGEAGYVRIKQIQFQLSYVWSIIINPGASLWAMRD